MSETTNQVYVATEVEANVFTRLYGSLPEYFMRNGKAFRLRPVSPQGLPTKQRTFAAAKKSHLGKSDKNIMYHSFIDGANHYEREVTPLVVSLQQEVERLKIELSNAQETIKKFDAI